MLRESRADDVRVLSEVCLLDLISSGSLFVEAAFVLGCSSVQSPVGHQLYFL